MIWYKDNNEDITISTRVRLARNLDATPFPALLKDKPEVTEKIKDAVLKSKKDFEFIDLDKLSQIQREIYSEEHLISPQMIDGKGQSVLINKDKTVSIMLMEEDHIRLQIIEKGADIKKAYKKASEIDDIIEESLAYAFDEEFGYLTACPTNVGTGLRASVMLHLPALTMTNNIGRILSSVSNMGITVRGLYGEGTKAYGNLYQVSNQVTLGVSEEEIIEKLDNIVGQIIEAEQKARKALFEKNGDYTKNKIMRSYGILKYAHTMDTSEARALLSDVMLGQSAGIIPKGSVTPLECMVSVTPAVIGGASPSERDLRRAKYLRENI